MSDPFEQVRGKRMGELTPEQTDLATELWLRQQIGPSSGYWFGHITALTRIIDRLRADNQRQLQSLADLRQLWILRSAMLTSGKTENLLMCDEQIDRELDKWIGGKP